MKGPEAMDIVKKPRIGVIGGNHAGPEFLDMAREVGRLVAERGGVLVCGGLGGVMEAAARGAKEAAGLTIGIIPGNHPGEANAFIDMPIATGMGYTRNSLIVMNADVLIAVDGEYGTLSEIAYAVVFGKKVFGLGTWDIKGVVRADGPRDAVERAFAALGRN
jgi:uncharacterized protein (TIGR00725 family)